MKKLLRCLSLCVLFVPLVASCSPRGKMMSVNVIGVNYSELSATNILVVDPTNPKNIATTMGVGSYQKGGVSCCYDLPRRWRPDLKVELQVTRDSRYYSPNEQDTKYQSVDESLTLSVPKYTDKKPGDLYVIRHADGSYELLLSEVEPGHPDWAGKVKTPPVPSLQYRRDWWDLYIRLARDSLERMEASNDELLKNPQEVFNNSWKFDIERNRGLITENHFTGPEDPRYQTHVRQQTQKALEHFKREVERLEGTRP